MEVLFLLSGALNLFLISVWYVFKQLKEAKEKQLVNLEGINTQYIENINNQDKHIADLLLEIKRLKSLSPPFIEYKSMIEVPQIASDEYREQILKQMCSNLVQNIFDDNQIVMRVDKSPKYTDSEPLYSINGSIKLLIEE